MEENTGSRIKPYQDFVDLFPPAPSAPGEPAPRAATSDDAPVVTDPGRGPADAEGSLLNGHRTRLILQTLQTVMPAATVLLSLLAVAAGGAALWLTQALPAKLDALHASQLSLQAEVANGFEIKREVAALTNALRATQSHLTALDEAVARQTNSVSQPRQFRELAARVDTLTAAVQELHARAAEARAVSAAGAASDRARPNNSSTAATWAIRLSAFSKEKLADAEVARLRTLEIPAEKRAFEDAEGRTWYRVFVRGFASRNAAENARTEIQTTAGIPRTWLERIPERDG